MNSKEQKVCECFIETDRMINEGLGNGTVDPRYTEAHSKLKEKQELQLLSILNEETSQNRGVKK